MFILKVYLSALQMFTLFPYKPRPYQFEIMDCIRTAVTTGKHLVLESCTGSGKTICALVPAVEYALAGSKKVVYLTRTNAQQQQVILELRRISQKKPIYGIPLQGRRTLCLLLKNELDFATGTSEELSRICSAKKKKVLEELREGSVQKTCIYYANLRSYDMDLLKKYTATLPTAEEFANYCAEKLICPYEANKLLAEYATVVIAPYAYLFDPFIRESFLKWLKCNLSDIVLIVDEAHNLPDYARNLKSAVLSEITLNRAIGEASDIGNPMLAAELRVTDLCVALQNILSEAVNQYVVEEDGLVPNDEIEQQLMHKFSITSLKLEQIIAELLKIGEQLRDKKVKDGKLPRSYIHSVASFLLFWHNTDAHNYVKLVVSGKNPRLECYCLDPVFATDIVRKCHASIHMSGTMRPLEEYRDTVGLPPDTILKMFPSPFPAENLTVGYLDDVTTRYEEWHIYPELISKLSEHIEAVTNNFRRNTVVFFPSFNILTQFLENGLISKIKRSVFVEEQELSQADLMETVARFKDSARVGSVLFAVVGGRISEGLDFPARQLEIAILVGIPYPKPTAKQRALCYYFDMKFKKGWEYTVKAPAVRRLLQSIGRLIRNETDIGCAIILDKRAIHFKEYFERLERYDKRNLLSELELFFKKHS